MIAPTGESRGYLATLSPGQWLQADDIIRAKVTQPRPSVQLTTAGPHLGVIKALCRRCRAPLVRKDKGLWCNNCERAEVRKLSDDYGEVEF